MTTELEPPVGLSVWERELFEHLVEHMRREDELVERYEEVAAEAGGHVAYLLRLVIDDERRHHHLFEEWANALRAAATMQEVEGQLPQLTRTDRPDEIVAAVRTFLAAEKADEKDLGRLRKLVKDVREQTVWEVLVDAMDLDTRKHVELLEFIERHPGR